MTTDKLNAISTAQSLARETADYIAGSQDRDNWSRLDAHDEIPEGDYVYLRTEFGEVTAEMEAAYRAAFNGALEAKA